MILSIPLSLASSANLSALCITGEKKVNNKVGALISAIKNDWKESSGIDNSKNPKEANFTQREYDYDDLEKKLLGWDE